jgi:hypothetical protein
MVVSQSKRDDTIAISNINCANWLHRKQWKHAFVDAWRRRSSNVEATYWLLRSKHKRKRSMRRFDDKPDLATRSADTVNKDTSGKLTFELLD